MDPRYQNSQMPPQNQMPGPYPPVSQQDPYGFITNSAPQTPKNFGPSSMKGRVIVASVGLVVLIILTIIVSSILGSSGKAQTEQYLAIAKSQTEIIRISALAETKTKTLEGKSLASTTRLAFTTVQQDMNALLAAKGIKQKDLSKALSASKNVKSDELLNEAEKNNRYDETYSEILRGEIENYQKLINAAAGGAVGTEIQTLEYSYNQATLIFNENL